VGLGGPKWGCREWCTRFGASESIYKISHTKRSHCKRNPDRLRRLGRPRLHIDRRVYERGHSRQPAKRERQRAHKLCRAASWQPLGGDVRHCRAPLQVQDTALNTQFIPHRACVAPYGLPGFGRSRCKPNPRPPRAPALGGAGGERRGRRSLTVDPESWALWVTGRCLSLMQSLWGYARGGSFALKSLATPPLGALRCCPRPAPAGYGHCRRRSEELRRGKRMGFGVDLAKAGEVSSSADLRGLPAFAAKPCQ
jgi:hypothetical protein